MDVIKTARLDLTALTPIQLRMYLKQPDLLERKLALPISRMVITERVQRAIRMKLDKIASVEPVRYAWYTYWLLVIREISFGAGLAGFKGFPDENGEVEIGYGIDPAYQGQGYMTEAVERLISWAFKEPACLAVTARDTKRSNTSSLRVLAKVGMHVYAETEDACWLKIERSEFRSS
jgi:[ribosomal protein S5]-alanine N-acetyltransferase